MIFAASIPYSFRNTVAALRTELPGTAPNGVMDYIFLNLILWGQQQGYKFFNLGMAPLSGLENRSLGTVWNRVGALTYRFGENFYNFQGLRHYKDKFDPEWLPRYMAYQDAWEWPMAIAYVSALIAGSWNRILMPARACGEVDFCQVFIRVYNAEVKVILFCFWMIPRA